MTTKHELISQVESLHERCEAAKQQLWQQYFTTRELGCRRLYGDFNELVAELGLYLDGVAPFAKLSLTEADQNFYDQADRRMNQLLARSRELGVELTAVQDVAPR